MEKIGVVHKVNERSQEEEERITEKQFIEQNFLISFVLAFFRKIEMFKIKKRLYVPYGSSIVCVVKKV